MARKLAKSGQTQGEKHYEEPKNLQIGHRHQFGV
jgi:hypothetical protein